jgi:hypothetical protein
MNKQLIAAILMLFCFTLFLTAANTSNPSGKIQSFQVQDAPYDDGAGIMLTWKPLPKAMRIIQYRIYRGVSPDTLFLFGQVEVDATAGVAADKMYYYDKDYQMFLSIDSPGKLKKEKQQLPGSPLYNRIPRDPKILKQLFPHFSILGIVDQSNLYHHSIKVTNPDGSVSAGVRPAQFEQLAANPNVGERYYYTVMAVDEKGKFLPYADIQSAVPVDNPPDTSARLATAFLNDKQEFNFEWVPPFSSFDIANWQFWLMPKSQINAFNDWQTKYVSMNGAPAPWTKSAILLAEKSNDYAYYLELKTRSGQVINPDGSLGAKVPVANLQDYVVVFACQDYNGYTSYTMGQPIHVMNSAQLPAKAVFTVADKPDDKGDTNTLSFGLPIGFISMATYTNTARTKIRINYETSDNIKYKIEAISFKLSTANGKQLGTILESYPDKIITLRVPKNTADLKDIRVEMAFRFKGAKQFTDYYVHQNLLFDNQSKRFMSDDIYYKNEDLTKTYYNVFRKNLVQQGFMPIKKLSTISRNYDDIINFESTLQKMVTGVDVKSGRLLLDPTLNFALDAKTGMPLSINMFKDEQQKHVKKMQDELAKLKTMLKTNPAQADSINQEIAQKEMMLNTLTKNPTYIAGMKINNPKSWFRFFHKEQLKNSRSYAYLIMKTDNEAAFTLSDPSTYYLPIPNWFNWNFLIALIASIIFTLIVLFTSYKARHGADMYLRPIAGLQEIDNAVGRATEMGRPILYVPGWSTIGDITTIASMLILNRVAKKAAEYDTRIMVPNSDYYVMPLAQEMVREAFYEAGRPDSYNQNDVFYVSSDQFPYAAGVNGTIIREKCATVFYMGFFNAEALLMTETGNAIGAIQIAGTDAVTQVPFFITTCDYTLIGEEFYAASAYLSKDAELVSMLKAQDYFKFLIVFFILLGSVLATLHFNWLTNSFPLE